MDWYLVDFWRAWPRGRNSLGLFICAMGTPGSVLPFLPAAVSRFDELGGVAPCRSLPYQSIKDGPARAPGRLAPAGRASAGGRWGTRGPRPSGLRGTATRVGLKPAARPSASSSAEQWAGGERRVGGGQVPLEVEEAAGPGAGPRG